MHAIAKFCFPLPITCTTSNQTDTNRPHIQHYLTSLFFQKIDAMAEYIVNIVGDTNDADNATSTNTVTLDGELLGAGDLWPS